MYNVFDRYFNLKRTVFKGALAAMHLRGTIISGGHLQWSSIFKGTMFFFKQTSAFTIPFFKGIELTHFSPVSHFYTP